jgi:hypothetical protein
MRIRINWNNLCILNEQVDENIQMINFIDKHILN